MSRFWGAADDSESDEESVVSSEEKNKPEFDYLRSSSSESSGKRVVVGEREKRLNELRKHSTEIKNLLKINDWNGIQTNFELLNKELTKAKKMVEKSGVPVCYLRTLVRLEEALKKTADLDRKSLSSVNAKALNIMKQKLKKNNTPYEADIQKYKEKPIESGDEGDDDEDDEDEDEDASASGSDEDDDDEDEDDEDEDEDDEDEEEETAPKKKKEKKAEKQPERLVWTREVVKRKLTEICASRGKKGSNQFEQISQLKSLAMSTSDIPTRLEVIYVLISTQFDTKNTLDRLPHDQWISILFNAITALDLIESDPSLIVVEESAIGIGDAGDSEEQEENKIHVKGSLVGFCERLDDEYSKSFQLVDPHTQDYVARLKDESLFLLLAVRSESFYQRKGDTQAVNRIALRRIECLYWKREDINPFKLLAPAYERAHKFIQKSIAKKSTVRFKESANENESAEELADQAKRTLGERGTLELTMAIKDVIRDLATQIYKTSDERAKTRAMLCQIYNYALEDCYFEARDLLLMSHLQENIHLADVLTQILFNRSIVQLGLCAFRHGFISDAHSCLCDLFTSGRVKELLAQGVSISRFGEKNWEQEKQAKARQIPFHMHIAIELIDSVHLICAMLLEVPNMAMNTLESKKKIISKPFRKLLDHYKIEVFTGPPENNHDVIVSASKALISGNVDRCWELISSLKVWKLIPNEQKIKDMLVQKIREEGLRAYMFKYSHLYKSISGAHLAETFKLSPTVVHSLISKMIVNEELHASLDQPTDCVVMHRVEPTHFQHLAMQFAEKITSLVESNERILDTKTGSFGYNAEQQKGGRGDHHHHQKDWQGRRNGKNNRYQPRQGGAYYAPPKGSNIIEQSNENEIN